MTQWLQLAKQNPLSGAIAIMAIVLSLAWWTNDGLRDLAFDHSPVVEQPLQVFTSNLLHVNAVHLIFNCWWLMVLGTWIEHRFGWKKTLGWLLLWSSVPALAEVAFFDGGVGLSGVVYAQWAFVAVLRRMGIERQTPIGDQEDALFAFWFVLCIFMTVTDLLPVANVAHGVGALLGASCALIRTKHMRPGWIATIALVSAAMLCATVARPRINFSPSYTQQVAYEAWQLSKDDRYAEAEPLLRIVIARRDDARAHLKLARALWHLDRREEAGKTYRMVYERWPNGPRVSSTIAWWKQALGYEATQRSHWSDAIRHYQESVELDPDKASYWHGLGAAHDNNGDPEQARIAYERCLRLDGSNEAVRLRLQALNK